MHALASAADYLGIGLGAVGGVAGVAIRGFESAVLWLLVGYFLGKSLQSTLWLFTDRTT